MRLDGLRYPVHGIKSTKYPPAGEVSAQVQAEIQPAPEVQGEAFATATRLNEIRTSVSRFAGGLRLATFYPRGTGAPSPLRQRTGVSPYTHRICLS